MALSDRYRKAWDGFWEESDGTQGEPFWDAAPALTAERDLALLEPYADPRLPIADLGCGNGTQTRFLATRFARAIGVDLAGAAVAHARRADPGGVAEYEQLDLADAPGAHALHGRIGDTNVYLRAVLHQSDPEDRPAVAASVAALLGATGRALVLEPTDGAAAVLGSLGPTPKLLRVREHDLRPGRVADGEVAGLLRAAGLSVLAEGETSLTMSEVHADGTRVELPARWFVAARGTAEKP
ncbi:class I SAM-dependent methyltransferase [Streptomyces sp. G-G2]|uniref:class I SAM-dependent methyltransferase n=1 Tax=Streptomyces sp. G-G2 TaxID=3046201 RepID=UPI0024BB22C5|nr:class I SAM-dependent methyltransferase [Streptomyces sp. G-G2]MDJ0382978.1 class I SAM-dependent methyltransferase [Streptomyces sp. G-G2]